MCTSDDAAMIDPAAHASVLTTGDHRAVVNGIEQHYHVAGRGPVCLVHSGGPGVGWEYLRMPHVEAHLTLVYIEPIGTGNSGRLDDSRGYRIDRYADQVHGLVTHLSLERAYLLGHSHGGFVAQSYALHHPERVEGLILYDTTPTMSAEVLADAGEYLARFAERHADASWLPDMQAALEEELSPDATDEQFTRMLQRSAPVYFADYVGRGREFAPMLEQMRGYVAGTRGEEPAPFDTRTQLGSITAPTLVIVGRYDPICSVRWGTALHEGIVGSELVVLEQSGHFAHIEEPEAFAEAIQVWLETSRSGNDR